MFYFVPPIKILFIDDDIKQLDALKTLFSDPENIFLSNADTTEEEIKNANQFYKKFNSMIGKVLYSEELVEILLKQVRGNEVAVIVADYDLKAKVNGLDLLKKITNKYVMRILCTGVVDVNQANEAFNNRQIENYFQKSDSPEKLINFVEKAKQDYYESINNNIHIKLDSFIESNSPLKDKDFQSFFQNLLIENRIASYSILDLNGSYFLIDTEGEACTLFVVNDDTIAAQIEILEEHHLDFWSDDIKNKKKFLYINNDSPRYDKLIFDCRKIQKDKNYSYSLVRGNFLCL